MIRPTPRTPINGLTLIETLVALVLLSGVAVATAALLRSVSDVHAGITPELQWATYAERALQCVTDDATIGDRNEREPHIIVRESLFIVYTRGRAPDGSIARLEVRFEFESVTGRFVRKSQALDDRQRPIGPTETSTLLGSVDALHIEPIQSADLDRRGNQPTLAYKLELRSGDNAVTRVVRP